MKNILRIPTLDQYAYLEIEFEGTPDEAFEEYKRISTLVKGGVGLPQKEMNRILDHYILEGTMTADEYETMSLDQQTLIQHIKRHKARIKSNTKV